MVDRVQVRTISNDEGTKLLTIVRRSRGSVVTWRRAQMVLLSAQGMAVPQIAEVTFTNADRGAGRGPQLQRRRLRRAETDGRRWPGPDDPTVVICCAEFGPLNLPASSGRHERPVVATSAGRGGVAGGSHTAGAPA